MKEIKSRIVAFSDEPPLFEMLERKIKWNWGVSEVPEFVKSVHGPNSLKKWKEILKRDKDMRYDALDWINDFIKGCWSVQINPTYGLKVVVPQLTWQLHKGTWAELRPVLHRSDFIWAVPADELTDGCLREDWETGDAHYVVTATKPDRGRALRVLFLELIRASEEEKEQEEGDLLMARRLGLKPCYVLGLGL